MKVGDLVIHKSMNVTGIVLHDWHDMGCCRILWSDYYIEVIDYKFIEVLSESR